MDIVLTEKQRKKLQKNADIKAIQMLMAKYVRRLSQMDVSGVFDELFDTENPDVSVEICDSGKYIGPEHVRAYYDAYDAYLADGSDKRGWMELEHLCTPYIMVNDAGDKAMATWSLLAPSAKMAAPSPGDVEKLTAYWFCGKYYCSFAKKADGWRISSLHKIAYIRSPFDIGWMLQGDCVFEPVLPGIKPDEPPTYFTYNADYSCASGGLEWGPYMPEERDFK